MYESPVNVIYGEMQTQIEGDVFKAIQNVGIDVNKEELIKAMQYDREQYSKGYSDGYVKGIDEFISRLEKHTQENWIDHQEYGITWSDIEQIVDQLKEGAV